MPHGKEHVKRVVKLAKYIAEKEGADLDVVIKAAELHDIARENCNTNNSQIIQTKQSGKICENYKRSEESNNKLNHAIEGAKIARNILEGYDKEFVEKVIHCIESHSFSSGIRPKTLEAKVLSDADKLDAIGAIGIARAFIYAGKTGRTIEDTLKHFEEKLLKIYEFMETETGKKLAEDRQKFILEFYKKIKEELDFISNIQ